MRLKIIAGNLAVVILLGVVAFLSVGGQLRSALGNQLDADMENARVLFDRSVRLAAHDFLDQVQERAASRQLRDVFGGLDLDSRRTRAYEAAESTHAWLGDPARGGRGAPDIVVVVDETGKALARNGARNVMFGKALTSSMPALATALQRGVAIHDVWQEDEQNKVLQTAIAPIRSEQGTLLGALVVGYDLSNGLATAESKLLGRDVAFIVDNKVYGSSLDGAAARDLKDYLFGAGKTGTQAVLAGQANTSPAFKVSLGGDEYSAVTSRLPMAASVPVAFSVLGNRTKATQLASTANVILVLLAVGVLLVLGYGFAIGNAIMRPIEQIEEGVLAVINGRTDLRLETDSTELGGLAFRINQLLNVLTGTEEASDDEGGPMPGSAGTWKDAAFADAPASAGAGAAASADDVIDDPALAATLGAEPEEAYSDRIYREYVAAKQALGENVSNIPKDRFMQRLRGRADALVQKHGCRSVRFQVHTLDNQVVLRPVLIR